MSGILTRRSLLAGAGYATAYSALAARVLSLAEAEEAQPKAAAAAMLSMTMTFPIAPKAKIDEKKYMEVHLPLLRRLYGDSVERIEFRSGQSPASGMPQTSVLGITHMWIKDAAAFSRVLTENSKNINLDLDVAAKGPRLVQVDRTVFSSGDPLSEVKVGHQVLTVFYPPPPAPSKEAVKFDPDFFKNRHVPNLLTVYGLSTIRRIEGILGQDQGENKAQNKATVHVYIRDRVAYDKVAVSAMGDLIEDAKKFTTIIPEFNELRVQAIV